MAMAQFKHKSSSFVGPAFEDCFVQAEKVLKDAADAWSQGHPKDPTEVLTEILRIFEKSHYGFLRVPSNRAMRSA
jgi:hypothetical protein